MGSCKPISTLMNTNEKLLTNDGNEEVDARMFRSLVGRLIYLTHTRPDITFPVSLVSRFMHQPSKQHFDAVKRIPRYITGTKNLGIYGISQVSSVIWLVIQTVIWQVIKMTGKVYLLIVSCWELHLYLELQKNKL